jgi:hypothetical protein
MRRVSHRVFVMLGHFRFNSMTHNPKGVMKDGIRYFMRMGSWGLVKAVFRPVVVTFMLGISVGDGLSHHDVVASQISNGDINNLEL